MKSRRLPDWLFAHRNAERARDLAAAARVDAATCPAVLWIFFWIRAAFFAWRAWAATRRWRRSQQAMRGAFEANAANHRTDRAAAYRQAAKHPPANNGHPSQEN